MDNQRHLYAIRDPDAYAVLLARLTGELIEHPDEVMTAQRLVERVPPLLPGADHVSITVSRGHGHYETLGATSPVAVACDALQYQLCQGPCIEAISEQDWYRSSDVAIDRRWPDWGPKAADEGIASLLSVRLKMGNKPVGALNCYGEQPGQFTDHDELDHAFLYALHAAAALGAALEIGGLQTAMQSRHTIGVAQGVLMGKYDLSVDRAFDLMRRYSSSANMKLRDLAEYVVEHGELPDPSEVTE